MFFFFKQKTAYEMRISDWSSDVCSSDLEAVGEAAHRQPAEEVGLVELAEDGADPHRRLHIAAIVHVVDVVLVVDHQGDLRAPGRRRQRCGDLIALQIARRAQAVAVRLHRRSEEHTSELQSLMRISYAVFC